MILVKKQESLNENQRQASKILSGPVLVIAGAGTGKTKTLVHRMFHLVESGLSPESILLLTFTRRAASEMLTRASGLLDQRMQKVSGGTFHSFGNAFLRKYAPKLGFTSNYSILDIEDASTLVGIAREEFLRTKVKKRFPKKETILEIISTSFNTNLPLDKVVQKDFPQFVRETKEIQSIKEIYVNLKLKSNSLDFDDLLYFTRKLLVEEKNIRSQTADRYRSILVDEYQDTNKIQAHIACLIASEHSNIMVVGDEAQSIYGFRGAEVRNILDFPKIFPETKIIKLEENFRSAPKILDLANAVLSKFSESYEKKLFSLKDKPGVSPSLYLSSSEEAEADYIANCIIDENENGVKFREIAVLSRSGWHTNLLELVLGAKNIPYKKYGGKKFLEQAHVKDLVSYLKILLNPLDWLSWNRVISSQEHVGPKQTDLLLQILQRENIEFFFINKTWEKADFWMGFSKDAKVSLCNLLDHFYNLNQLVSSSPLAILEQTLTYYLPLLKIKFDDHEKRSQDLETIRILALEKESLIDFLSYLSLETTESFVNLPEVEREEEGYVTLSTIHSAKGLEWEVVFMMQLVDGQFPSSRLRTKEDLEEERRLFYVAVTRAKSKLYLTAPVIESGKNIQIRNRSRFLTEIESEGNLLWTEQKQRTDLPESIGSLDQKTENSNLFDQIQTYFLN